MSKTSFEFDPPASIEAALLRKLELDQDIRSIQVDLERKLLTQFPDAEKYMDWRRRATKAQQVKVAEVKYLNNWVVLAREQVKTWTRGVERQQLAMAVGLLRKYRHRMSAQDKAKAEEIITIHVAGQAASTPHQGESKPLESMVDRLLDEIA